MTGEHTEIKPGDGGRASSSGWSYLPRVDIAESDDEFTILADLPGATAGDIRLNFENRTLTIHGTVQPRRPHDGEFLTQEYGVGDFDRAIILTDMVQSDRISAEYDHGVLTVRVPKSERARPRRIPVQGASPQKGHLS